MKKDNDSGHWTTAEVKSFKERQAKKAARRMETDDGGTIVGARKAAGVTDADKNTAIQQNLDVQKRYQRLPV